MIRSIRFLCLWCVPFLTVPIPLPSVGAQSPDPVSGTKRPIKVADAIGMVRLADSYYFQTGSSEGRVAHFSPDGKKFVVLLKQSDLGRNINTFSLLLFRTADVFHSPAPHLLLTMSSSSNRDAIHAVKWLADSKTLAFLGENPGELPQVYTIDIRLRRVEKLTNRVTAVTSYDITPDGRELIFGADLPTIRSAAMVPVRRDGIVITSQELDDILAGNFSNTGESKLFIERLGRPAVEIPLRDAFYEGGPLSLSPDGRYAMVGSHVREIPNIWPEYRADPLVHAIVVSRRRKGETVPLLRYLLVDTKDCWTTPL